MHFNQPSKPEADNASSKKARLGVWFFFVYLIFYAGFVVIGVVNYDLLRTEGWAGLNLAVIYGMGLILFAIFLGIIYNFLCSGYENEMNGKEGEA